MARTTFNGPIAARVTETDGSVFIPATLEYSYGGTWTKTRTAAGDYNLLKTAAADTTQSAFNLSSALFKKVGTDPLRIVGLDSDEATPGITASRIRGVRIKSVDVYWKNTTSNLTSGTFDLLQTTHANQSAANPVVSATVGGTLTGASLTITASANTRVERVTLSSPYVLGANLTNVTDWAEITWIAAAGSVITVYGIQVNFDYNLL
jgi:hypothetical protein